VCVHGSEYINGENQNLGEEDQSMAEFTDRDRERLHDMWAIVTNGLRDTVKRLAEQYEVMNETLQQTIQYVGSEAWHDDHCPILKNRRKRRKSWDWYLVVGVAVTSIIMNVATVTILVVGVL